MKILKSFYQNRYFTRHIKKIKKDLKFPLDFTSIKRAIILFSDDSEQKGFVPIIKNNIQHHWNWMPVTMISSSKINPVDVNFWGFLNDDKQEEFSSYEAALIFPFLSEKDVIGRYLLTIIPASLIIGINSSDWLKDYCNILINTSRKAITHPTLEDGKKLFNSLIQLQKKII